MKISGYLFLSAALLMMYSCNQSPKHPQANYIQQPAATAMTEESISLLADSIDANISKFEKQTSLVFQSDNHAMYVERYSYNGKPVMYSSYTDDISKGNVQQRYYLQNDSLLLLREHKRSGNDADQRFTDTYTYLRNNIPFKIDSRTAGNENELTRKGFRNIKADPAVSENKAPYQKSIQVFEDALQQKDQFDMRFADYIAAGEESYIQLKSSAQNGYSASVMVDTPDALIDSLIKSPSSFKNEKIRFQWKVMDKEAIYVPVASRMTSASGLKR
ncbi:hypothetical protein PBAL39_04793 [Pedobacter sp. BAL39]|uniref:hypothetical protein n=1 Tax=Pedobacter sp. BAL39 TaxID=391596 RepID=UPI000155A0F2|nr:hypothetical protein [Pedobacter sp. BAL39]EDM37087.1 hypothetical protein PBAL39_04793 [Pedobacter sp. BAL39]